MQYWLMKSEPDVFGIDDLQKVGIEPWDGVRNYQARNMLRDQMQIGDQVFFYHSNCDVPGIVGIAKIATQGYPDDTAFNPEAKYFDPKSDPQNPRWYRVDVQFVRKLTRTISLYEMREHAALQDMPLVRKGCRLSIMPVSATEWQTILDLE
ncbi:EVE domain-containing protein [Thiothrix subterranea]|uniref:EVE domain-containing protein n=1 Tax=Thiothrix subterranea TaxID=2735563 RepID=A0AA51R4P4_9GAMM|nr:EVE domain-containing protein [Thiothrix subterranea]MDQ5770452.1 EVE domain-containing protein [Thiothrix subterranea]WML86870.1 EVE domain-containing protein [Thiothrix subterranea]